MTHDSGLIVIDSPQKSFNATKNLATAAQVLLGHNYQLQLVTVQSDFGTV
jgi:flagellar biogenesis protein FliO